MPYYDQHAGNISRLITHKGDIAARTVSENGRIWGNAVENIGNTWSRSLLDIARQQEEAPKIALQKKMIAEQSRNIEGQRLTRELTTSFTGEDGITDYDGVAKELRVKGYADVAESVSTKAKAAQDHLINQSYEVINRQKTALGRANATFDEIKKHPDKYAEYYASLVEQANAIDPSLAPLVPKTYDELQVTNMRTVVSNAATMASKRSEALRLAMSAREIGKDNVAADAEMRKSINLSLSTAKDEGTYNTLMRHYKAINVPVDLLQSFGEWDDGAGAKRAAEYLETPAEKIARLKALEGPNTPSEMEAAELLKEAHRLGFKSVAEMPGKAVNAWRREYHAATRAPSNAVEHEPLANKQRREAFEDERREWENVQRTRTQMSTATDPDDPTYHKQVPIPYRPFKSYGQWQTDNPVGGRPAPTFGNVRAGASTSGAPVAAPAAVTPAATPPTPKDYGYGPRWSEATQSYSGPPKGDGFLGPLEIKGFKGQTGVMSEYSRDGEINGQPVQYPLIVPTLNQSEVQLLLTMKEGSEIPQSIEDKARAHAEQRIKEGKDVFAGPGEQNLTLFPSLKRKGMAPTTAPVTPPSSTPAPSPKAPAPPPAEGAYRLNLPGGMKTKDGKSVLEFPSRAKADEFAAGMGWSITSQK